MLTAAAIISGVALVISITNLVIVMKNNKEENVEA